jgi:5-methylcytosine-specific restriction endonuclease McrA
MFGMAQGVLVLNATYEPLSVVSVRRAVALLLAEKAEMVETAEAVLRSQYMALPQPLVIRLVYYVKIPRWAGPPLTRRGVLARDGYTCQYCGAQPGARQLTVDHVLPRSRGGRDTWENVVAACAGCNGRKGSRTPEEAKLTLRRQPRRPRYLAVTLLEASQPTAWHKYVGGVAALPA